MPSVVVQDFVQQCKQRTYGVLGTVAAARQSHMQPCHGNFVAAGHAAQAASIWLSLSSQCANFH